MPHVYYPDLKKYDPRGNVRVTLGDADVLDAAGRLRVSLPLTLFDQTFEWDLAELFWDQTLVGGGTVTYDANNSSATLTVGTGATDSVIRQSRDYHHYRPWKSHLIPLTFTFGAAAADVRRRAGYFEGNNGIYLEQNGTTDVALVRRTFVSGGAVDNRVVRASWNLDTLSPTAPNPSGVTQDLSLAQLMVIDLQWLSEGRVRIGFKVGGAIIYVHEFNASNILVGPYMETASLPIRFELTNLAGTGTSHTLRQGCSSVITEDGDQDEFGLFFSADNGTTAIAVTTRRAILSIRPKAVFGPSSKVNRVPIEPQTFNLLVSTNNARWEIVFNPTFTGTPVWVDPGTHSAVEYSVHGDAAAGAFTAGIMLNSGYAAAGVGIAAGAIVQTPFFNKLRATLDIDGANPRAFSLVVTSMTGTSNAAGAMSWKESR
jgi:hypothetical protein